MNDNIENNNFENSLEDLNFFQKKEENLFTKLNIDSYTPEDYGQFSTGYCEKNLEQTFYEDENWENLHNFYEHKEVNDSFFSKPKEDFLYSHDKFSLICKDNQESNGDSENITKWRYAKSSIDGLNESVSKLSSQSYPQDASSGSSKGRIRFSK